MTFYLKISPEFSEQRQKIRNAPKDYFEKNDLSFYQKLVEGYETACELFPSRLKTINGEASQEIVAASVQEYLQEMILSSGPTTTK